MHHTPRFVVGLVIFALFTLATGVRAEGYPKPSIYPTSWELNFEHAQPKRIVVQTNTDQVPHAYWYMTYTVTNNTKHEQLFLPVFELVTQDGTIIRSDNNIPKTVFDKIKKDEGNDLMINAAMMGGELRLGQDEARDGVAIWREPSPDMGHFTVYISGLSGETATVKGPDKKPVILRKTLEIHYATRGDAQTSLASEVFEQSHDWVMR
jgi:hypothetical protein